MNHAVGNIGKTDYLLRTWDNLIGKNIKSTTNELSVPKAVSEETVLALLKSVNK